MKKGSMITLSIVAILLVITGILFGAVFCLRKQTVKNIGATEISISHDKIIGAAGLKNGKSIFMIDKEKAIENVETKFPYLKVVQIKTIGVTSIEFCVRARHEMFYTQENEKYYVLDEDLKVLNIIDLAEAEPVDLIQIKTGTLKISTSAKVSDFIGSSYQQDVVYNLFNSMSTVVTKSEGSTEEYLTRDDVKSIIDDVDFSMGETYNRMILKTNYGVLLDIERPEENMQYKINICFSTIEEFISQVENKEQSGTIKIYYDQHDNLKCVYVY